jgi:hypothetical protein
MDPTNRESAALHNQPVLTPHLLPDPVTALDGYERSAMGIDPVWGNVGLSNEKSSPTLPVVQNESSPATPHRLTWWQALKRLLRFPFTIAGVGFDLVSLMTLVAVVAAIPLLQLASLGYLLLAGSRLADRRPLRECLPGLRLAGRIGVFAALAGLLWIPTLLIADLARSAELLQPGTEQARRWLLGAFLLTSAWLVHVGWAAMRGGRWYHLLWPAPLQFIREAWRPKTWSLASDQLYDLVASLRFPKLWWLGARATVGALVWLALPVTMMIIGQRTPIAAAPLVGLIGALLMSWVMFYLPFLQLRFAQTESMSSFWAVKQVKRSYQLAPWAHSLALVGLSVLAIPLYLLRIEPPPQEFMWALSLIFAFMMLPGKLLLGWALGYADGRQQRGLTRRRWWVRSPATLLSLTAILFYIGALYVAQLVAEQGAPVMYFQHAFLVPNPFSAF